LAEVGSTGVHDATPVGPVTTVLQVVTTLVDELVPGVQVSTPVVVGVTLHDVVTKLPLVPGVQEVTAVGPVVLAEQVTFAQPLLALGPAATQLAAGVGPVTCEPQVVVT
jgi:hypothetical protein